MPVDRIRIVQYEPAWPSQYRAEAAVIGAILSGLALRIDHVGSTAVPGLAAKPVIDIQVSAASLQARGAFDEPGRPGGRAESFGVRRLPAGPSDDSSRVRGVEAITGGVAVGHQPRRPQALFGSQNAFHCGCCYRRAR